MSNEEELFADGLGPDGIFLRAADRRRFDFVLRAVRDEGASLALSSTNDEVLDHYGRLVIKKLRLIPDLQVEVFLPANTEALLDRFNEILAGLSLTDARNAASSPAPRRVMIAHATGTPEEIRAEFRRVRDQIRLVFEAYAAGRLDAIRSR